MANKLYTEEQVRQAIDLAKVGKTTTLMWSEIKERDYSTDEILNSFTPIELPSDEEINERSYYDKDNDKLIVNAAEIARFRNGAKWLRDKILNQNNKQ